MLRLIAAIVGGVAVAFALVFATDALFHLMPSSTPPADPSDAEAMRAYVASQPPALLAAMVAGWAVAAFAGSAIAARFGGRGRWPGWVVTALFLIATASNFVMIPHPVAMMVAAVVLIVAAGWFGATVGARGPGGRIATGLS